MSRPTLPPVIREPRRTSLPLSLFGYAFLLLGILLGGAAVLQVPALVAISCPTSREREPRLNYGAFRCRPRASGSWWVLVLLVMAALVLLIARGKQARPTLACRAGEMGLFITVAICIL